VTRDAAGDGTCYSKWSKRSGPPRRVVAGDCPMSPVCNGSRPSRTWKFRRGPEFGTQDFPAGTVQVVHAAPARAPDCAKACGRPPMGSPHRTGRPLCTCDRRGRPVEFDMSAGIAGGRSAHVLPVWSSGLLERPRTPESGWRSAVPRSCRRCGRCGKGRPEALGPVWSLRHFPWYKGCGPGRNRKLFRCAKDSLALGEIRNLGELCDWNTPQRHQETRQATVDRAPGHCGHRPPFVARW
jgi:hypothetical protein